MSTPESRLPPPSVAQALRAVIFDMDGLMLDTERWERAAWREVACKHGYTLTDEFFASLVGLREADTQQRMREHFGAQFPLEATRLQARERFDQWMRHCPPPVKRGLSPLLDTLSARGIRFAVASSTSRTRAAQRLGRLAQRFRVSVFGDEVRDAKPHPEIYQRALALLGIPAEEGLALEDSPAGFTSARAAGLVTIVIPDLLPPPPEAPYVCRSLIDIQKWILTSGTRSSGI